jgi:chemotaxis protein MotB
MDNQDNNSSFSSALTDLMTSLAVIFILLLVVYLNHSYQEIYKGSAHRREKVLETLKDSSIDAKNDENDPLSIVFAVEDNNLQFDLDKAAIKPDGQKYLNEFMPTLINTVCSQKNRHEIQAIQIIGYTDSQGDEEHNLKLSQDRALSVLKYGLNNTKLTSSQRECLLDLSSINGRGERDLIPMGSKPGKENKSLSRRVEFKIRVKSYEQIKKLQEGNKIK